MDRSDRRSAASAPPAEASAARSYLECAVHGREPLDVETYVVCPRCRHPFTASELLDARNYLAAQRRAAREPGAPSDVATPDEVTTCPLCTEPLVP